MKIAKIGDPARILIVGRLLRIVSWPATKGFPLAPRQRRKRAAGPCELSHGADLSHVRKRRKYQVDIKAERPITIFLTRAEEWKEAPQHPEAIANLRQLCLREHVVETRFVCFVPPEPMTLIIQDERNNPDAAVFAGLGAVLDPHDKVDRAWAWASPRY